MKRALLISSESWDDHVEKTRLGDVMRNDVPGRHRYFRIRDRRRAQYGRYGYVLRGEQRRVQD